MIPQLSVTTVHPLMTTWPSVMSSGEVICLGGPCRSHELNMNRAKSGLHLRDHLLMLHEADPVPGAACGADGSGAPTMDDVCVVSIKR